MMKSKGAARIAAHRSRIRQDEKKYEAYKKSEAQRQRELRAKKKATMSLKDQTEKRKYECERKKRQREKKKLQQTPKTTLDSTNSFSTKQSKGKAIARAKKGLPQEKQQKTEVLIDIVHEHSQTLTPSSKRKFEESVFRPQRKKLCFDDRKKRADHISDEIRRHVQEYYERDDVSRMLPGKKDVKRVIIDGKPVKKQKRLLVLTTQEAHALYKKEFPNNEIGKTKFQEFRPPWVLPTSGKDQDVCLCKYHENAELLLRSLRNHIPEIPLHADEAVKLTVCSMDRSECIDRLCDDCGVSKLKDNVAPDIDDEVLSRSITYYQWCHVDGKVVKQQVDSDIFSALEELQHQMTPLARHVYNVYRQHAEMKELKENLQPGEIIVQEDFSENYNIKQQGEIMSAHWHSESCTLFTIMVYYRQDGELKYLSYTMVSDDLSHTKNAVYAFNKILLSNLVTKLPFKVNHVHYWSDGAGSQFKNRFCFANMLYHEEDFGPTMDWSYFETAHGKGPVDGVGGTVKRVVWLAVLRNKVVVNDAEQFADVASTLCKDINVLYVSAKDIKAHAEAALKRVENCHPVPETHKLHFVRPLRPGVIATAVNTSFENNLDMKEHKVLPQLIPTSTTSSHQAEPDSNGNNSRSKSPSRVKTGDFIIASVEVKGKAHSRTFVGQVVNISENQSDAITVRFMKKITSTCKTKFSFVDEPEYVTGTGAVKRVLETPVITNRQIHIFPEEIEVTE